MFERKNSILVQLEYQVEVDVDFDIIKFESPLKIIYY